MKDFHQLKVWEKVHKLTLSIYLITKKYPKDETYGLVVQMRRSAASIPTNIAEGCGRDSQPEFIHFLNLAMGSASELDYQLTLSHDLIYIIDDTYAELSSELQDIRRMLSSLIKKVKLDHAYQSIAD